MNSQVSTGWAGHNWELWGYASNFHNTLIFVFKLKDLHRYTIIQLFARGFCLIPTIIKVSFLTQF